MRHAEEVFEPAKRPRHDGGVPILVAAPEAQLPESSRPKAESQGDGGDCFASSNPELWRGLAAGLGLHCQDAAFLEQLPHCAEQLAAEMAAAGSIKHHQEPSTEDITPPYCASPEVHHLATEGYSVWSGGKQFQDVCRRLREAADRLRANGWPPLYLLAYDEAWLVTAALGRYLCGLTGLHYQCNLDFFAWHILPGGKGWAPHRDRPGCRMVPCNGLRDRDNAPQPSPPSPSLLLPSYITAWASLTESTRLNSCISVLPLTRDCNFGNSSEDVNTNHHGCGCDGDKPSSGEQQPLMPLHPEGEAQQEQEQELPDMELPVQAGQVLVWGGRTLHCGGPSHAEAPEARISLAVAFSIPDDEQAGAEEAEWVRVDAFKGWSSALRENKPDECIDDDDDDDDATTGNHAGGCSGDADDDASDQDGDDGNDEKDNGACCDRISGWHLENEIATAPLEVRIRCIAMQLEFYSDVQPVPHHIQTMIDNM